MPRVPITDLDDPRIAIYRNLKATNRTRCSGQFVVEGEKLLDRLLTSTHPVASVLAGERHESRVAAKVPAEVPLYVLPHELLDLLVGFNFHQGVLACGVRCPGPDLAALVAECRPHVIHLSGHGDVDAQGRGVFAFEDERGRTDVLTADEIAARVFRGNDVRLAFINGCKSSQAAVSGLCRGLVAAGVPSALGWAASVADDRATDFTAEFYRRLVRNERTPAAAAHEPIPRPFARKTLSVPNR